MEFKNAKELLELCRQEGCPISQIMRRRECELGETTPDTVDRRMARALEIMRQSASIPCGQVPLSSSSASACSSASVAVPP